MRQSRTAGGFTRVIADDAMDVAIADGTIVGHALRVARANPVHALRYE